MFKLKIKEAKICVIGLGYIGLPLYTELTKKFNSLGYDINKKRILELKNCYDRNNQISKRELKKIKKNIFFKNNKLFKSVNTFIITVPTPIYKNKKPNLGMLIKSSKFVGKILTKGSIVIYESTVYPGLTNDYCVPILEKYSKLKFNKDFFCGYSPERINPGDKKRNITNIKKITSGSTPEIAELVDKLYKEIIKVGTYKASSIKVAEAAKVIENTQRDLNIALVNELSVIFSKMGIDSLDVLDTAASKWNFLNFRPGFVGGHCIGVDPYYLSYKSIKSGYRPKIILTGREINDSMPRIVFNELINLSKKKKIKLDKCKILIFGVTFKENVSDTRNSKVLDLIEMFLKKNSNVFVYDPLVKFIDNKKINLITKMENNFYDIIIYAVNHKNFKYFSLNKINKLRKKNSIFYDLNYVFDKKAVDLRL